MIDIIKKVLTKLASNIEAYKVYSVHMGSSYNVRYSLRDTVFYISYYENNEFLVIDGDLGSRIHINIPEDDKYEILNLFVKLRKACEEHINEEFVSFATSVEISKVNTIDDLT